jgi:hypothetical protein
MTDSLKKIISQLFTGDGLSFLVLNALMFVLAFTLIKFLWVNLIKPKSSAQGQIKERNRLYKKIELANQKLALKRGELSYLASEPKD